MSFPSQINKNSNNSNSILKNNQLSSGDEPEDFAEQLLQMNENYYDPRNPSMHRNHKQSQLMATPRSNVSPGKQSNSVRSQPSTFSQSPDAGSQRNTNNVRLNTQRLTTNDLAIIPDDSTSINQDSLFSRTETFRTIKKQSKLVPKLSYRLASPYEGKFGFKSKEDMQQPFYPLKFIEVNLAFTLDSQKMMEKNNQQAADNQKMSIQTSQMAVAVKHMLRQKLSQHMQTQSTRLGGEKNYKGTFQKDQLMKKLTKEIEGRKQTTQSAEKCYSFRLEKVRSDNRKLPFQLLKDVPGILKESMKHINQSSFGLVNKPVQQFYGKEKSAPEKETFLERFIRQNKSGFTNMIVYMFWIMVSDLFHSYSTLSFSVEFIESVRQAMNEQYQAIYFNYLVRLKQELADQIIEILPFLMAQIMKQSIYAKIQDHKLPLEQERANILLAKITFKELIGYEIGEIYLKMCAKKFIQKPSVNSKRQNRQLSHLASQNSVMTSSTNPRASSVSYNLANSLKTQQTRMMSSVSQSFANLIGTQEQVVVEKSKASVFSTKTYDVKRDKKDQRDFDPNKLYGEEIYADMVNEMIKGYNTAIPDKYKKKISKQIKEMDVAQPSQVLAGEHSKSHHQISQMRRQIFQKSSIPHTNQSTLSVSKNRKTSVGFKQGSFSSINSPSKNNNNNNNAAAEVQRSQRNSQQISRASMRTNFEVSTGRGTSPSMVNKKSAQLLDLGKAESPTSIKNVKGFPVRSFEDLGISKEAADQQLHAISEEPLLTDRSKASKTKGIYHYKSAQPPHLKGINHMNSDVATPTMQPIIEELIKKQSTMLKGRQPQIFITMASDIKNSVKIQQKVEPIAFKEIQSKSSIVLRQQQNASSIKSKAPLDTESQKEEPEVAAAAQKRNSRKQFRFEDDTGKKLKKEEPSQKIVSQLEEIMTKLKSSKEKTKLREDPMMMRFQTRVQSALIDKKKHSSGSEQKLMHQSGRKFRTDDSRKFDLQYCTPMLRKSSAKNQRKGTNDINNNDNGDDSGLRNQLLKSHFPSRKRKNLLMIEKDYFIDKEDTYKSLIQGYLDSNQAENEQKQRKKRQEELKEEKERLIILMNEQQQKIDSKTDDGIKPRQIEETVTFLNKIQDREVVAPNQMDIVDEIKNQTDSAKLYMTKVNDDQLRKISRRHQQYSYAKEAQAKRLQSESMWNLGREISAKNKQQIEQLKRNGQKNEKQHHKVSLAQTQSMRLMRSRKESGKDFDHMRGSLSIETRLSSENLKQKSVNSHFKHVQKKNKNRIPNGKIGNVKVRNSLFEPNDRNSKSVQFYQGRDYQNVERDWLVKKDDDNLKHSRSAHKSLNSPSAKFDLLASAQKMIPKPVKKGVTFTNSVKLDNNSNAIDKDNIDINNLVRKTSHILNHQISEPYTKMNTFMVQELNPRILKLKKKGLSSSSQNVAADDKKNSQKKKRKEAKRQDDSLDSLKQPFSEKDTRMQMTRKASHIIRENKSYTSKENYSERTQQPFHYQLMDYIKQYPETSQIVQKKSIEDEIVRKRIDDSIPANLKRPSDYFVQRPLNGYLSDKHTYSSMRKGSSVKSRKVYVFDSYTANSKPKVEKTETLVKSQSARPVQSGPDYKLKTDELKTYHVYRFSNFQQQSSSVGDASASQNEPEHNSKRRPYLKPPQVPQANQAGRKSAIMSNKMFSKSGSNSTIAGGINSSAKEVNRQKSHTRAHSQVQSNAESPKHHRNAQSYGDELTEEQKRKQKEDQAKQEAMADARRQQEMQDRVIGNQNDNDDKADVRDGIAETKGIKRKINNDYGSKLKLVPREENTKVFKMLKEMRVKIEMKKNMQEVREDENKKAMEIQDSDDEKERHSEGSDIIVSRPNPLEPPEKKSKMRKQDNRDSKGHPATMLNTSKSQSFTPRQAANYQGQFNGLKRKYRKAIPQLKLHDAQKREQRTQKQQHFD